MSVKTISCPMCGAEFEPPVDVARLKLEAAHAVERAAFALRQARLSLIRAGLHVAGHTADEAIQRTKELIELFRRL